MSLERWDIGGSQISRSRNANSKVSGQIEDTFKAIEAQFGK